jgi:hypothetical protein
MIESLNKNPVKIGDIEVKGMIWEVRNAVNNDLVSCDFGYQVKYLFINKLFINNIIFSS